MLNLKRDLFTYKVWSWYLLYCQSYVLDKKSATDKPPTRLTDRPTNQPTDQPTTSFACWGYQNNSRCNRWQKAKPSTWVNLYQNMNKCVIIRGITGQKIEWKLWLIILDHYRRYFMYSCIYGFIWSHMLCHDLVRPLKQSYTDMTSVPVFKG